jgi:hypothetical protein
MPPGHVDGRSCKKWKAPRARGFGATGCPVRRHHRAASFDEWHYTTPDLRRLQLAAAALTGDTRTVARDLARCTSGTGRAVLRTSDCSSTPAIAQRQRYLHSFFTLPPVNSDNARKTGI